MATLSGVQVVVSAAPGQIAKRMRENLPFDVQGGLWFEADRYLYFPESSGLTHQ